MENYCLVISLFLFIVLSSLGSSFHMSLLLVLLISSLLLETLGLGLIPVLALLVFVSGLLVFLVGVASLVSMEQAFFSNITVAMATVMLLKPVFFTLPEILANYVLWPFTLKSAFVILLLLLGFLVLSKLFLKTNFMARSE